MVAHPRWLDNRDDMLREAKKMIKELRASLEDARTRLAELETQVLDSMLEICRCGMWSRH
jgi:predicted  nucleic acid-binding Zn-ribbon protein